MSTPKSTPRDLSSAILQALGDPQKPQGFGEIKRACAKYGFRAHNQTLQRKLLSLKHSGLISEVLSEEEGRSSRKKYVLASVDTSIAQRIRRGLEGTEKEESTVKGEHLRILLPAKLGELVSLPKPREFWDIYADDGQAPPSGSIEAVAWHLAKANRELLEYLGRVRRTKFLDSISSSARKRFLNGERAAELVDFLASRSGNRRTGYSDNAFLMAALEQAIQEFMTGLGQRLHEYPAESHRIELGEAVATFNRIAPSKGVNKEEKLLRLYSSLYNALSDGPRFLLFYDLSESLRSIPLAECEKSLLRKLARDVEFYRENREQTDWLSLTSEDLITIYSQLPITILEVGEQIKSRVIRTRPDQLEAIIQRHFATGNNGEIPTIDLKIITEDLGITISDHAKIDIDGHYRGAAEFLLRVFVSSVLKRGKELDVKTLKILSYWQEHRDPRGPPDTIISV